VGRKEQAATSRGVLVDSARACFSEQGYEATTVAAILQRAHMARGALYHYFPGGKADIFAAVFEAMDAEYHDRRDAMLQLPTAIDRLMGGVKVFLDQCTDDGFARVVLNDAPRIIPGQNELGTSYKLLREQLADGMRSGELRALDVEATAMALYGAIRSAGEWVIGSPEPGASVGTAAASIHALLEGLSWKRELDRPS
jgi:AcrR family transcriptional regulator